MNSFPLTGPLSDIYVRFATVSLISRQPLPNPRPASLPLRLRGPLSGSDLYPRGFCRSSRSKGAHHGWREQAAGPGRCGGSVGCAGWLARSLAISGDRPLGAAPERSAAAEFGLLAGKSRPRADVGTATSCGRAARLPASRSPPQLLLAGSGIPICPQDRVDASLIPGTLRLEPLQQVCVDAKRNRSLRWNDL